MTRAAMLGALLFLLAACGPQPIARPAPSGQTAGNGGGEAALGNVPRGTTNFPYRVR